MIDELHKLHEFAHWHRDVYVYDDSKKGRVACTKVPPFEGLKSVGEIIDNIARAIEHTIASRYIELPVDSDGVPIKPGDKLVTDYGSGEVYHDKVDYIMWDGKRWDFWHADDDSPTFDVNDMSDFYSHVKHDEPDTVETLLDEYAEKRMELESEYAHCTSEEAECVCLGEMNELLDEYAAKLRELMGGDA